jgi:hypothetical protein
VIYSFLKFMHCLNYKHVYVNYYVITSIFLDVSLVQHHLSSLEVNVLKMLLFFYFGPTEGNINQTWAFIQNVSESVQKIDFLSYHNLN